MTITWCHQVDDDDEEDNDDFLGSMDPWRLWRVMTRRLGGIAGSRLSRKDSFLIYTFAGSGLNLAKTVRWNLSLSSF